MKRNIIGVIVIIIVVLGFWQFMGTDTRDTEGAVTYVEIVDQPSTTVVDESFSCVPAEGTELRRIGDTLYCVTTITEGIAGSAYHQYAYAYPDGTTTSITAFSVRFVQCTNYDAEEQAVCSAEQNAFNPDTLLAE